MAARAMLLAVWGSKNLRWNRTEAERIYSIVGVEASWSFAPR